jgi:hypothetical protein
MDLFSFVVDGVFFVYSLENTHNCLFLLTPRFCLFMPFCIHLLYNGHNKYLNSVKGNFVETFLTCDYLLTYSC